MESSRLAVRSSLFWVQELTSPAPTRTASPGVGRALGAVTGGLGDSGGEAVFGSVKLGVAIVTAACSELLVSRNMPYRR